MITLCRRVESRSVRSENRNSTVTGAGTGLGRERRTAPPIPNNKTTSGLCKFSELNQDHFFRPVSSGNYSV